VQDLRLQAGQKSQKGQDIEEEQEITVRLMPKNEKPCARSMASRFFDLKFLRIKNNCLL